MALRKEVKTAGAPLIRIAKKPFSPIKLLFPIPKVVCRRLFTPHSPHEEWRKKFDVNNKKYWNQIDKSKKAQKIIIYQQTKRIVLKSDRLLLELRVETVKIEDSHVYIKFSYKEEESGEFLLLHCISGKIYYIFEKEPSVDVVVASVYKRMIDKMGHRYEGCVLSVKATREIAMAMNRTNLSIWQVLSNFNLLFSNWNEIYSHEQLESQQKMGYGATDGIPQFDLNALSPKEFEDIVGRLLKEMNFSVESTKTSGDGGIDLVAVSKIPMVSGKYIIQCKRYSPANKVGVVVVRDLYGVMNAENANKGIAVTTSSFTNQAKEFAQGKPLELIEGQELLGLLKHYIPDLFKENK